MARSVWWLIRGGSGLHTSIYIHRIKKDNVDEFLALEREAGMVYMEHGAVFNDIYRASNLTAMYGCVSFTDAMDVDEDEEVLVVLSGFDDQAHHDRTMSKVDSDPRIQALFAKVTKVITLDRTVRGEFELVE